MLASTTVLDARFADASAKVTGKTAIVFPETAAGPDAGAGARFGLDNSVMSAPIFAVNSAALLLSAGLLAAGVPAVVAQPLSATIESATNASAPMALGMDLDLNIVVPCLS
ncbi:hypothetical protein [Lacisediminihabitans profunda]|uniref:hypothetical protein n=1 Tax=Lacisediminihabitans profunda TaxID=2594790 RepID=UPI001FE835B2|nr:hypothetical protein [Lacisediminihabitans profunda]